jgi:hypothetical protein
LLDKHRVNCLSVCCSRISPSQWSPASRSGSSASKRIHPGTRSYHSALKRSPQCLAGMPACRRALTDCRSAVRVGPESSYVPYRGCGLS